MPLTLTPPAFTQTNHETTTATPPAPSCHRDLTTSLPICALNEGCSLTGGDCPTSQAEIDKCPGC